jgi:adenine phosphoribosyltransferase
MTAAVDGIPMATLVANILNVDLVIAKKEKEVGVENFLEEVYIPKDSAVMMSFYIPKKAIKRGDSVLIVDDVIRSGETQRALINLVEKAKAEVAGIFSIIVVGDEWRKKVELDCPFETILELKPHEST